MNNVSATASAIKKLDIRQEYLSSGVVKLVISHFKKNFILHSDHAYGGYHLHAKGRGDRL